MLKVGIAGYGVVGKRRRTCIDAIPAFKTVAVADRSFGEDGHLPDGTAYYRDFRSLLAQEKLDVLFVCLTNDVAAEATRAGLVKGCHVFCEKPPGRTLAEVGSVWNVAKERPELKLKYGFNHRYHDSVRDALRIVQSGELGQVIDLKGVYGKSSVVTFDQTDWRTKRDVAGGGILLDQGIHMVDLMRLFGGEYEKIHSVVSNAYWNFEVEDNAYALMTSNQGVTAMLHSSATQWRHRFRLDIGLTKGAIILSGILSGSKSYGEEEITVAYRNAKDKGIPKEQTVRYNEDNSWSDEIAEFHDAITNGSPILHGSVEDAYRTLELVFRIYGADPRWAEFTGLKNGDQK